jgi:hypothetical protein
VLAFVGLAAVELLAEERDRRAVEVPAGIVECYG